MRFVELKSEEQLDMQTLHRARDRLVGERTALINQLRAILLERGIVIAQGRRNLERELDAMLCEEQGLAVSPRLRKLIEGIREEWRGLDRRIAAFDDEFAARAKTDEAARRLATIPGIGVLNATALARRSAKAKRSLADETLLLGSALCPGRSRQAASLVWSGLPREAIAISASC
jgi:transposase